MLLREVTGGLVIDDVVPPLQAKVLTAIARACAAVAVSCAAAHFGHLPRRRQLTTALCAPPLRTQDTLRSASVSETGTSNALGDKQLVADVEADR